MPTKNVWVGPSSLADEAREFLGAFERDLLRTISLDRVPSRQARLREVAVNGPGEIDPPPEGLVDRSNRLRGHSRDQGACRKLGVLSDDRPARHHRPRADQRAAVDRRVHADQAIVSNGATMDDGRVADSYPPADHCRHAAL